MNQAFRNEDGAIDLSSIMVGIIVIGLIGGVIAATVFAVIPWAQDNAAKQQLDSIHTAQNAYFGLNADPSRTLGAGETRNTFTDSAGLANANLLTTGGTYCTVPLNSGKDYQAYSKSASGIVFTASNSNKKSSAVTDPITDGCSALSPDNLTPVIPPGPVASPGYSIIDYWDFETDTVNGTPKGWYGDTGHGWTYTGATTGYDGTKGIWANQRDVNNSIAVFRNSKYVLKPGTTYKLTAWTKFEATQSVTLRAGSSTTQGSTVLLSSVKDLDWNKRTFIFSVPYNSQLYISSTVAHGAKVKMFMDDIVLEERLP